MKVNGKATNEASKKNKHVSDVVPGFVKVNATKAAKVMSDEKEARKERYWDKRAQRWVYCEYIPDACEFLIKDDKDVITAKDTNELLHDISTNAIEPDGKEVSTFLKAIKRYGTVNTEDADIFFDNVGSKLAYTDENTMRHLGDYYTFTPYAGGELSYKAIKQIVEKYDANGIARLTEQEMLVLEEIESETTVQANEAKRFMKRMERNTLPGTTKYLGLTSAQYFEHRDALRYERIMENADKQGKLPKEPEALEAFKKRAARFVQKKGFTQGHLYICPECGRDCSEQFHRAVNKNNWYKGIADRVQQSRFSDAENVEVLSYEELESNVQQFTWDARTAARLPEKISSEAYNKTTDDVANYYCPICLNKLIKE